MGAPPKNCLSPWGGSGPTLNTWYLGPTRVRSQNSLSIGSAVFAHLIIVSNRQTHTDTQTTLRRQQEAASLHAMRPKNSNEIILELTYNCCWLVGCNMNSVCGRRSVVTSHDAHQLPV